MFSLLNLTAALITSTLKGDVSCIGIAIFLPAYIAHTERVFMVA